MEISQALKSQIEEIINNMECPKDFACYKSGFTNVCKAKRATVSPLLECSEEHPEMCRFSLKFVQTYFCECPFRHYIAKGLGIYENPQLYQQIECAI